MRSPRSLIAECTSDATWTVTRERLAEFLDRRRPPAVRVGYDVTLTTERVTRCPSKGIDRAGRRIDHAEGDTLEREVQIVIDAAQPAEPTGSVGLPRDLTEDELEHAPVLESVDDLLIDDLTDVEADAFYAALDA